MSFALTDNSLVGPVAETLAREVGGMPAKEAARLLGTSLPTITRIRRGEMPSAGVLLAAIKYFGVRILEPVIGKFDDANLLRRLDAIEGLLKEVRHARPQPAAPASAPHRDVGAAERGNAGAEVANFRLAGPDGDGVQESSEGAALALVQIRRPFTDIEAPARQQLTRHLTAFGNVVSLDAARDLARAGVAYKRPGEDWTGIIAPKNRLWTPSLDPRPISAFEGDVAGLRRDLDEASHSAQPILVTHAGAIRRGAEILPFHSDVVRIGGKAKCGAEWVITDFLRNVA